jgi:CRP-like cAMP-binding protein
VDVPKEDAMQERGRNHFLSSVPSEIWRALSSKLEPVELPRHKRLETKGRDIEWVYFFESGIGSVVGYAPQGRQIETGIVGYEGMVGATIALGDMHSTQNVVMQVAGMGRRLQAAVFRSLLRDVPQLQKHTLSFVRALMIQSAQTAVANGTAHIPQRLARWLVMLDDRIEGDVLAITHAYIAVMLAVARPGVSLALKALEREGLIETARGLLLIRDRDALIKRSDGLYGATEREYRRLLNWQPLRSRGQG